MTIRTLHFTLYTIYPTHYTFHSKTLHYILQIELHTSQSTLHTVHCTLYAPHSTLCIPHATLYTWYFHALHLTFLYALLKKYAYKWRPNIIPKIVLFLNLVLRSSEILLVQTPKHLRLRKWLFILLVITYWDGGPLIFIINSQVSKTNWFATIFYRSVLILLAWAHTPNETFFCIGINEGTWIVLRSWKWLDIKDIRRGNGNSIANECIFLTSWNMFWLAKLLMFVWSGYLSSVLNFQGRNLWILGRRFRSGVLNIVLLSLAFAWSTYSVSWPLVETSQSAASSLLICAIWMHTCSYLDFDARWPCANSCRLYTCACTSWQVSNNTQLLASCRLWKYVSFFSQIDLSTFGASGRKEQTVKTVLWFGWLWVRFGSAFCAVVVQAKKPERRQVQAEGKGHGYNRNDFLPTSNSTCWSLPPTSTNIRFGAFLGFFPAPLSNKHPQRAYISSRHRNFEPDNCKKKRGQEIMILKQQLGKETQVDSDLAIWRWHQVGLPSPLASTIWKGLVWIFWMCFLQKRLMEITWKSNSKGWGDMEMMETTYVWFGHIFPY